MSGGLIQFPNPAETFSFLGPGQFNHTTYLNKYFSHITDLGQAANIIHETLHAFFISKFNAAIGDSAKMRELAEVYGGVYSEAFDTTWLASVARSSTYQHDLIITNYLAAFSQALYEFGVARGMGGWLTRALCKDLAYWGTWDSDMFAALPSTDKKRIQERFALELDPSGALGLGMPQPPYFNPWGTPCP